MRYSLLFTIAIFLFTACKKDKFTTAPQIDYKSISPKAINNTTTSLILTIGITDAEGDIGIGSTDTAFVYLKNLLTNDIDSLAFPPLQTATKSNFQAEVDINVANARVLNCHPIPGGGLHIDTLYFEVYVKDFAKNKSNVIVTAEPVYYQCF